eukprot:1923680-Alexandrium_andersonii.AAC.1
MGVWLLPALEPDVSGQVPQVQAHSLAARVLGAARYMFIMFRGFVGVGALALVVFAACTQLRCPWCW